MARSPSQVVTKVTKVKISPKGPHSYGLQIAWSIQVQRSTGQKVPRSSNLQVKMSLLIGLQVKGIQMKYLVLTCRPKDLGIFIIKLVAIL